MPNVTIQCSIQVLAIVMVLDYNVYNVHFLLRQLVLIRAIHNFFSSHNKFTVIDELVV